MTMLKLRKFIKTAVTVTVTVIFTVTATVTTAAANETAFAYTDYATASGSSAVVSALSKTGTTYGRQYIAQTMGTRYVTAYDTIVNKCIATFQTRGNIPNLVFNINGDYYSDTAMGYLQKILQIVQTDNPAFYFFQSQYTINITPKSVKITIPMGKYADGAVRTANNQIISDTIAEYTAYLQKMQVTARYDVATAILNKLLADNDYTDKDLYNYDAHNIIGCFAKRGAVCEGFNEAYQFLANYFNVPTMTFFGQKAPSGKTENKYKGNYNSSMYDTMLQSLNNITGAFHQWSLSQLNDGKWYLVDATSSQTVTSDPSNLTSPNVPNGTVSSKFVNPYSFEYKPFAVFDNGTAWLTYPYPRDTGTSQYVWSSYYQLNGYAGWYDVVDRNKSNGAGGWNDRHFDYALYLYDGKRNTYADYNLKEGQDFVVDGAYDLGNGYARIYVRGIGAFRGYVVTFAKADY